MTDHAISRTRVACKGCHARRVKCDAADRIPCMQCRARHIACELIDSKRGRYTRTKPSTPRRRLRSNHATNANSVGSPENLDQAQPSANNSQNDQHDQAETAECPPAEPSLAQQTEGRSDNSSDSLTLSYALQTARRAKEANSQHLPFKNTSCTSFNESLIFHSSVTSLEPVSLQDALVMPDRQVSDKLIRSFFQHFFPAYPVIDRVHFASQYDQGEASPFLLHTIYMVALTSGPENLVEVAGYPNRTVARKTHYLRAKALYDADYEKNELDIAAALHLLSFWWLGPHDAKDSWYWQGIATTFAQSLLMHRSLSRQDMAPRTKSIWKRIWWSIYIRDRHAAAALGHPCRIRDEDCDVEPLNEEDLLVDANFSGQLLPLQKSHHVSYFLENAKFSKIFGDIVIGEFSPHRLSLERFQASSCLQRLRTWYSALPEKLHTRISNQSSDEFFWASMLSASYQSACILLFRPPAAGSGMFPEEEREMKARAAADVITRTAEDLLASKTIHYAQLHLVPAVFSALSIHTLAMDQASAVQHQLAENKSKQCILALKELSKNWQVGTWIVKSFSNLLRRLLNQEPTLEQRSRISIRTELETSGVEGEAIPDNAVDGASHQTSSVEKGQLPLELDHCRVPHVTGEWLTGGQHVGISSAHQFQPHAYPDPFPWTTVQCDQDSAWFGCLEDILNVEGLQKELNVEPWESSNPPEN